MRSNSKRDLFFYRTAAGAEIDLLIQENLKNPVAVEVKYSLSPSVPKEFWNAFAELDCRAGFVVYPGNEMYPLGKNVFALPVRDLGKILTV